MNELYLDRWFTLQMQKRSEFNGNDDEFSTASVLLFTVLTIAVDAFSTLSPYLLTYIDLSRLLTKVLLSVVS
ncbi:hypothetical protein GCM10007906_41100 [Vibrio hyugaensis]|uniref:Uncharacterized protein n=1 Tax=Vibrio hyugaensis TaxID=1534743 RepID=A0ABQ5Y7F7_9VIBR|nr:hypothetical protein GCM10007906_41100 [Vibrio hyugaensis]